MESKKNLCQINITLELPKRVAEELEKDFKHLETATKKPKEFHIREALIRYIEDMEDIRDIEKYIKDEQKGKVKYYTSKEVEKELKELKK